MSIRERLERLQRSEAHGVADRLLEIGRDTAARLPEAARTVDHGELLYDDAGLPR